MLYSIKDRENLETEEVLASLKNQLKDLTLQDKIGKQNFHEDMKKIMNYLLTQSKKPLKK